MNDQSQMMNQHQMMSQLMVSQAQNPMMPPPPQPVPVPQMVGQSYGQWGPNMGPPPPPNMNLNYHNHKNINNSNNNNNNNKQMLMYGGKRSNINNSNNNSNNWKGKKAMDNGRKRKDRMMMAMMMQSGGGGGGGGASGVGGGYQPPNLHELEKQNRLKARRFYPKKKYNNPRMYAHAPRNTTSYLIRAKKAGGIASLVSPCPVTPAVLPTPVFSPSREALVDMAKEEWGVDGYGTMKGLIRLRSPGHDEAVDNYDEEVQEDEEGSSESDVEELEEVEKRLDHDLSRFEMINPNSHNLENRVDDQDTHIAQLEDENLFLKEKVYYLERELGDLTRRLLFLERQNQVVEDINEEVVDNVSDNDSDGVKADGKDKPDFEFYQGDHGMPIFANFVDGKANSEGDKVNKEGNFEAEKGDELAEGVKVAVAVEDGDKHTVGDDVSMREPVAEKVTEGNQFEDKDGKSDGNLKQDDDEDDKFKNDTPGDVSMGTE